jgi:hypothetical protein
VELTIHPKSELRLRMLTAIYLHASIRLHDTGKTLPLLISSVKALGIRRWRIKAQDRNEWTVIKREAKDKLKGP